MTPERTRFCYTVAVVVALASALGAQLIAGIAGGDVARGFTRELVDLPTYWLIALPVCYLAAGVLAWLGPVRTWRWILTMIAAQTLYGMLAAGSGLSLWPLALVMTVLIALPGVLTGWLGGLIRRRGTAAPG